MSNRNFDASVIAKRLRDQNVAQQLYGSFTNGRAPGNPQTVSTQVSIITTEYYPGVQTTAEQSLQGTYTFSPGGIANYVPDPNGGPTGPTATVPGAPTIDSITPDSTQALVYFTAGTDGGSVIIDYKYALDSGSGFGSFISAGTTTSPITITGLTNDTTYSIKILAVNAVGDGAESNIESVTPGPPSGTVFTSPSTNVNVALSGQSPFGGSNYSYDFGSGDYLTLIADNSWAFGTGDFTIEWFQYETDSSPFPRIFAIGEYPTTSIGCSIEGGTFYAWFPNADFFGSAVPYKNQWVHFAIVRRSGNLYVYKNGVQLSSSVPNTNDITDNTTTLYIGVENGGNLGTQYEGYLTNFRIVKGLAVYTGDFTVPTSSLTLTASANPYGGSNTVAIPTGFTKLLLVPSISVPSVPQNLTVTPGVGTVNLYFTPPADDGGATISNYQYSTDNGFSWSLAGTTSSPITVPGLVPNGSLYNIKLRAINAAGEGEATSAISVASLSTFSPSDIPNQNVWLDAQNPSKVIVSSGQVTAFNDSSVAGNNFSKGPSGTITYDFPSGINSRPALNFTTSAPTLSTYLGKDNFNISATNQLTVFMVVRQTGNGVGNSELFFTRNDYTYMDIFNRTQSDGILCINIGNATQVSSGVDIITEPPTNALISFVADTTASMFVNGSSTSISGTARGVLSLNNSTLDWTVSGGAFLGNVGEVITYSTPLTTTQRQAVEGYLAWKWGTQDSLPAGHPYKSSPPSVTAPNPPTGLGATAGNGEASISFTAGSDGGSPITNYMYSTDGTNYTALSPADTASPITITGLTNGTTYSITLKAVNAIGDSIASASVSVTPANIPGGPINLIILGDSSVTTLSSSLQSAKTALGYTGTLTITTQQLNGYTGTNLSSFDMAIIYTNGGLNLNATLGGNLNSFVASGKHLIMASFCWGNVSAISSFDYSTNSTFVYNGPYTPINTSTAVYNVIHPITTGIPTTGGRLGSESMPSPITSTAGTSVIATYSDGTSFIATKSVGSANLVGIQVYPAYSYSSVPNTIKYICNSVYWCMGYLT